MTVKLADLYKSSESGHWKDLPDFFDAYKTHNEPLQEGQAALDYSTQQRRRGHDVLYEGVDGHFSQSWFVVCRSSEVPPGEVIGRGFLDGQVAIFRGENNSVSVISAYCCHVGANLACGKVIGNEVECAFHRWRFDQNGVCTKTGCGDPVPPGARVFKYPTKERFGLIWAFNGETPTWDLPDMGAPDQDLVFVEDIPHLDFNCDPWIVMANTLDWNHLKTVHGLDFEIARDTLKWTSNNVTFKLDAKMPDPSDQRFTIDLGIFGSTIYWQHGTFGDMWFSYIAALGIQRPGTSRAYVVIAAKKGDDSKEARQLAQECIQTAMNMEMFLISQDMPILNFVRFTRGTMTRSDRQLAQFLDYIRRLPRVHPGAHFIK